MKKLIEFEIQNTFNRYEKLQKPLRIILAMTVRNEVEYGKHIYMQLENAVKLDYDEIVILDDGSTDGTWDVLKEYASKYNHLRIKRNEVNSVIAKGENRWITLIKECAKYYPTWLHFRACDQLHSKAFNNNMRDIVSYFHEQGGWLIRIPLAHLWRSEGWLRFDNVWYSDFVNHSRSQLWRFYKDYKYKKHRHKAALHLGGHLPNVASPYSVTPTFNINSFDRSRTKEGYWRFIVLHYGHTTHEKKEVKFRLTMDAAKNGVSVGCPPPEEMPHPQYWMHYNGYKGFYEFNVVLNKTSQEWFDKEINFDVPQFKSFYNVIAEYRVDRAKEYQALYNKYKEEIPHYF